MHSSIITLIQRKQILSEGWSLKKKGSVGAIYPIINSKAGFHQAGKTHHSIAINETHTRITSFELLIFTGLQDLGFQS